MTASTRRARCATAAAIVAAGLYGTALAAAQPLPTEPVRAFDGRLVVGGEASATLSSGDDTGFFNYTDYEHNALRMLRLGLSAELQAGARLAVLGELRTENWDRLHPYALFVRIRPWTGRAFDIQAGRIPPVFGTFARRGYGVDSLLVGYPLAYQYLTSLRSDALPLEPGDLLRMRGRGWLVSYPVGTTAPGRGLPLINALRWDTGVQARLAFARVEAAVALTNGTLSNPRVTDNKSGRQVAGRIGGQPATGLHLGISLASGTYLDRELGRYFADPATVTSARQRALGIDAEYSRSYWIVRGELVLSAWDVPMPAAAGTGDPLRATAGYIEGRYRVRPRWYLAARADRLSFSDIGAGTARQSWDAPVSRIEGGIGWYLQRNALAKAVYQQNWRDTRRERSRGFVAGQLTYWF